LTSSSRALTVSGVSVADAPLIGVAASSDRALPSAASSTRQISSRARTALVFTLEFFLPGYHW